MFVIGYDYDEIICIINSEDPADAQEMILALAEDDNEEAIAWLWHDCGYDIEKVMEELDNSRAYTIRWSGDLYWYQDAPAI